MKDFYTLQDIKNFKSTFSKFKKPPKLCVIGNPISHSLSPQMHQSVLDENNLKISYIKLQIEENELEETFELLTKHNFIGANITIPFKNKISKYVTKLDHSALKLNGINCILFEKTQNNKTQLIGFNTDGKGFIKSILEEFHIDIKDLKIIIIGAGGAGSALATQCTINNCETLTVVNRDKTKLKTLNNKLRKYFESEKLPEFNEKITTIPLDSKKLPEQIEKSDLIVNTTSVGMNKTDLELFNYNLIKPYHIVCDIIYNPAKTKLLKIAEEQGARITNGKSMLVWQGAYSYEIWFDKLPNTDTMKQAI